MHDDEPESGLLQTWNTLVSPVQTTFTFSLSSALLLLPESTYRKHVQLSEVDILCAFEQSPREGHWTKEYTKGLMSYCRSFNRYLLSLSCVPGTLMFYSEHFAIFYCICWFTCCSTTSLNPNPCCHEFFRSWLCKAFSWHRYFCSWPLLFTWAEASRRFFKRFLSPKLSPPFS